MDPANLMTEPYRQRDSTSFIAKTGVDDVAYNPLNILSQVATALTVEDAGNFPLSRLEPAQPVTQQHRALVHASYGQEEAETVQLTTHADGHAFAYTPGPMHFSFPGITSERAL